MSMRQPDESNRITEFVEKLGGLDAADRARLRRNAGRTLGESRGVLGTFYRLAPYGLSARDEAAFFLVATLFPLGSTGPVGNMGDTMRRAQTAANRAGLDRRMATLLDAGAGQLPFQLRRAVSFAQSNRVPVNWSQLLADVLRWGIPDRPAQRRWARSYFGTLT